MEKSSILCLQVPKLLRINLFKSSWILKEKILMLDVYKRCLLLPFYRSKGSSIIIGVYKSSCQKYKSLINVAMPRHAFGMSKIFSFAPPWHAATWSSHAAACHSLDFGWDAPHVASCSQTLPKSTHLTLICSFFDFFTRTSLERQKHS